MVYDQKEDMDNKEAIMVLNNLLHDCETPSRDRLTFREKQAIKKGIELLEQGNLYECKKVIFVRLRKDLGFNQTGNFGFCTINKNSIGALLPCCEKICPLKLKVDEGIKKDVEEL